jgi:hypothetical protein
MTLVFSLVPHVLGPKYDRRQRSRNSQKSSGQGGARETSQGRPTWPLSSPWSRFLAPVDDTVTSDNNYWILNTDSSPTTWPTNTSDIASTARDPTLHTTWWTLTIYLDQQLYSDVQRIHVFPPPASTGLHTRTPAQSRSPKPGTERVAPCIDWTCGTWGGATLIKGCKWWGDSPRKTPQLETSPTELGSEVAIE